MIAAIDLNQLAQAGPAISSAGSTGVPKRIGLALYVPDKRGVAVLDLLDMHPIPALPSKKPSARGPIWCVQLAWALVAVAGSLLFSCAPEVDRFYVPEGQDIRSVAAGTWDWSTANEVCGNRAHTISFSVPDATMTLTHAEPVIGFDDRLEDVFVYDVVELTQNYIRGQIRGETRLTDDDGLVVWDLVLLSESSYCWHRTDWQRDSCTDVLIRCAE